MGTVHIANIDYEAELAANQSTGALQQAWERHPLCLQLQYLPLLYAHSCDSVAVTDLPENSYLETLKQLAWRNGDSLPSLTLLNDQQPLRHEMCESWGHSKQVERWAKSRQLNYEMPKDWSVIQKINSKAFSFEYTTLEKATLLWNINDLKQWNNSFTGSKVLKTCFGLSGKGNKIISEATSYNEIHSFCEKEWKEGRPLVAEPWLQRLFDFSTQWVIGKEGLIHFLGATVFETNARGAYVGTLAGPEKSLFGDYLNFLEEHKKISYSALQDIYRLGFFGHVGIDALLYLSDHKQVSLYPIVEVNARKTMSWVVLQIRKKWFEDKSIRIQFTTRNDNNRFSLLPTRIPERKSFKHFFYLSLL